MFTSTCAIIARCATSSATMRVEMIQMKCFRFIYACARYVFVSKGTRFPSCNPPHALRLQHLAHTLVATAALDSNGHRCLVGSFRNNYCLRSHPVLAPRYSGMQGACGASNFQSHLCGFTPKLKHAGIKVAAEAVATSILPHVVAARNLRGTCALMP